MNSPVTGSCRVIRHRSSPGCSTPAARACTGSSVAAITSASSHPIIRFFICRSSCLSRREVSVRRGGTHYSHCTTAHSPSQGKAFQRFIRNSARAFAESDNKTGSPPYERPGCRFYHSALMAALLHILRSSAPLWAGRCPVPLPQPWRFPAGNTPHG